MYFLNFQSKRTFSIMNNFAFAIFAIFVTAYLPSSSSLTVQCSTVRTPCNKQQDTDQRNNVEPCQTGQNYFNCLATAYSNANATGQCDELSIVTYKYDDFQQATVYAENCNNFAIPSSLQQNECDKQVAVCGKSVLSAFAAANKNDNTKRCSELANFKTCMSTNTAACSDQLKSARLAEGLLDYDYCVPTLSAECSRVRSPCSSQQNQNQNQNMEPCLVGTKYFDCLASVLSSAEQGKVCSRLPLLTYRHDSAKEAEAYDSNCQNFAIPSYLLLSGCDLELATCGSSALRTYVASNTGDRVKKCSELMNFKTCMESRTTTCTDRQVINQMINKELLYYKYQETCVDVKPTETTTAQQPVTATPAPPQSTKNPTNEMTTTPRTTTTTQGTTFISSSKLTISVPNNSITTLTIPTSTETISSAIVTTTVPTSTILSTTSSASTETTSAAIITTTVPTSIILSTTSSASTTANNTSHITATVPTTLSGIITSPINSTTPAVSQTIPTTATAAAQTRPSSTAPTTASGTTSSGGGGIKFENSSCHVRPLLTPVVGLALLLCFLWQL